MIGSTRGDIPAAATDRLRAPNPVRGDLSMAATTHILLATPSGVTCSEADAAHLTEHVAPMELPEDGTTALLQTGHTSGVVLCGSW